MCQLLETMESHWNCWKECVLIQLFWKTACQHPLRLNICSPYGQAILFPGTYQTEIHPCVHKKTCTRESQHTTCNNSESEVTVRSYSSWLNMQIQCMTAHTHTELRKITGRKEHKRQMKNTSKEIPSGTWKIHTNIYSFKTTRTRRL